MQELLYKSVEDMVHSAAIYAVAWCSVALFLRLIFRWAAGDWKRYTSTECLRGKTILITGANSGIGYETAKALVKQNAQVIFACRNLQKAKAAIEEIKKEASDGQMVPIELDLASFESIERFVDKVRASFNKIDVIINNAGVLVPLHLDEKTKEGFEMNLGVNHVGHFYLTNLLLDKFRNSNNKPTVSRFHENALLNFNDICLKTKMEDSKRTFLKWNYTAYANSKLMNIYFMRALADKLRNAGVEVNACCPGMCYTNVFSTFFVWYQYILMFPVAFFLMRSAKKGAETVVYLAADKQVEGRTGKVYFDCAEYSSRYPFSREEENKVWQLSQAMVRARKPI